MEAEDGERDELVKKSGIYNMKIAHVVWGMKMGGVETMLVNIINEQVKHDEVRLFIINDFVNDELLNKIGSICVIKKLNRRPQSKNLFDMIKLNWWIYCYRPDIIHLHSFQVSKLIFGKWNMVRTIHNTRNRPDEYPRMKDLYAISDAVAQYTINQGFPNVKTICNGIKADAFKKKITFKHAEETYRIVQISRLNIKQKGQHILIKALDILVNKYHVKSFTMHFIGEGSSKDMLQNMVSEAGLTPFVHFEGLKSQDYLYEHLCDYDLFIQPSLFEGFGLTVAEAIAAKVPVLVSDIEGPMEIIGNGKYGMHFKKGNVEDLAEKLNVVLRGGYDYSLVDKAYMHVCQEYDVSRTAQRYTQEYKNVLKKNR